MKNKHKILYIDDEKTNCKLFEINLRKEHDIITCNNGTEGLDILQKNNEIDIVFSDYKMRNMNGLEFFSKVKKLYPYTERCLLTGFDINDEIHKALESGMITHYFGKPFDFFEIRKCLTSKN